MLIEGGYLHSLKALLEKAEDGQTSKPPGGKPPSFDKDKRDKPRGLGASLRKLRAKLMRRTVN